MTVDMNLSGALLLPKCIELSLFLLSLFFGHVIELKKSWIEIDTFCEFIQLKTVRLVEELLCETRECQHLCLLVCSRDQTGEGAGDFEKAIDRVDMFANEFASLD